MYWSDIMSKASCLASWRMAIGLLIAMLMSSAWAGLTVLTDGTTSPVSSANQRTIDFSTKTLASEQTAGKLTYTTSPGAAQFLTTGGSVSYTGSTSLTGFAGNDLTISSGSTGNPTSLTINFATPTPYVGFMWAVSMTREDRMFVDLTLEDNSVVTLKNCSDGTSALCVGYYVSSNWLSNVLNALLGWILGASPQYESVYVQYQPSNGLKIKSMKYTVYNCNGCGLLSSNANLDFEVDNITYVDATVAPDHINITTNFGSTSANATQTYTLTVCGDAACSVPYISGFTGMLAISGAGTASLSNSGAFTIAAGPANSTTLTGSLPSPGTATLSLSAYSPTPTNASKKYFCGVNGATPSAASSCTLTVTQALHHLEVTTDNSAKVTCKPTVYTVKACADASCSVSYTGGVSGTLSVSGQTVNYPTGTGFSIGSGTSSTTLSTNITTAGVATVALSAIGSPAVYCGMNGVSAANGGSCALTTVDSAFLVSMPDHVSDTIQQITVSAVQKSATSNACTAALANASKPVNLSCTYANPTTGTKSLNVTDASNSSSATMTCGSSGAFGTAGAVTMAFDGNGVARPTIRYPDVGKIGLNASYTSNSGSDAGLNVSMNSGVVYFTAVPDHFGVALSGSTAPVKAGSSFNVSVAAYNSSNAITPNFNRESMAETATLTWVRTEPLPVSVSINDVFTGVAASTLSPFASAYARNVTSFSNGASTVTGLSWSEVGKGALTATLTNANYLGATGLTRATGNLAITVVPHHFNVVVNQACTTGTGFTYSSVPFSATVTAANALGNTTAYYDGSAYSLSNPQAQAGTLSTQAVEPAGSIYTPSVTNIAANAYVMGVANVSVAGVTLPNKLTPSTSASSVAVSLRASDPNSSSAGYVEGSVNLRSGRIKVSNAFGSQRTALDVGVQVQYWNGQTWVLNSDDSCTKIPVSSVALSNYLDARGGVPSPSWTTAPATKAVVNAVPMAVVFNNGSGAMTLSAPSTGAPGSVEFAFNLGPTTIDHSCLASHPMLTTATDLSWLRAQNGATNSCAGVSTYDRDPSARATFGVFMPETKKAVFTKDIY
jgi:MSHA biogenesis protein MshQ